MAFPVVSTRSHGPSTSTSLRLDADEPAEPAAFTAELRELRLLLAGGYAL